MYSVRDTNSSITTEELLAEPQNVVTAAYTVLKDAVYPLNLPFDFWLITVRQFLAYLETPLDRILELLRSSGRLFPDPNNPQAYTYSQIWAESLQLSPAEYAIFTDFDPAQWDELYGFDSENAASEVSA